MNKIKLVVNNEAKRNEREASPFNRRPFKERSEIFPAARTSQQSHDPATVQSRSARAPRPARLCSSSTSSCNAPPMMTDMRRG